MGERASTGNIHAWRFEWHSAEDKFLTCCAFLFPWSPPLHSPPVRSAVSFIDLVDSGWWVLLVSCVLLVVTLYFLVRASTSDPGIFLRLPPEPTYKWHAISQELSIDGRNVQLRYCRQFGAG